MCMTKLGKMPVHHTLGFFHVLDVTIVKSSKGKSLYCDRCLIMTYSLNPYTNSASTFLGYEHMCKILIIILILKSKRVLA